MAKLAKGERLFRKNEVLYKAGARAENLYILLQGLVSISTPGPEGDIELYKVSQPQVVGDESLREEPFYSTTATALNDVIAFVIPASFGHTLVETAMPIVKSLALGMLAKQTQITNELKEARIEEGQELPCPLDKVAKLFSVIYRVVSYTGKKTERTLTGPDGTQTKDQRITVEWTAFRKYCQRVFLESPVRIEQAMWLLVDIKFAEMQMIPDETDPDAPELLGYIHFRNIELLRTFAEFFRKNFNPAAPHEIANSPGAQSKTVMLLLKSIEFWNKNGLPKGMPPAPDPKSRFAPKKKAS